MTVFLSISFQHFPLFIESQTLESAILNGMLFCVHNPGKITTENIIHPLKHSINAKRNQMQRKSFWNDVDAVFVPHALPRGPVNWQTCGYASI